MSKPTVLFLCTGNAARSQMAEALLRHKAGDRFDVYSAGVAPSAVHPLAKQAVEEIGIEMAGHHSKHLDTVWGQVQVDHLIIVCGGAADRCPTMVPGVGERLVWPFEDPSGCDGSDSRKLARFREIRDAIGSRLDAWLAGRSESDACPGESQGSVSGEA